MRKQIEAQKGIPATQLLTKLIEEWEIRYPDDQKAHGSICAHILKKIINKDTCLTEEQMEQIDIRLRNADGSNMDALATALATFINSCRLECENCLNETCTMKDTESNSQN